MSFWTKLFLERINLDKESLQTKEIFLVLREVTEILYPIRINLNILQFLSSKFRGFF